MDKGSFRELLSEPFPHPAIGEKTDSKSEFSVAGPVLAVCYIGTMKLFDSRPRRLHVHFISLYPQCRPLGHPLRKTPFFLPRPISPCPTKGKKGTSTTRRIEALLFILFFHQIVPRNCWEDDTQRASKKNDIPRAFDSQLWLRFCVSTPIIIRSTLNTFLSQK